MFDFKPNAILDGMDRAQALACLHEFTDEPGNYVFAYGGKAYGCPSDMGIPLHTCPNTKKDGVGCGMCWQTVITVYYDAKEAAEKWVEPKINIEAYAAFGTAEKFYQTSDIGAEIARTNARRKIEAFIAANGGSGRYEIRRLIASARFDVNHMHENVIWPGLICCVSPELAAQIILRYPDELRLLCGVK